VTLGRLLLLAAIHAVAMVVPVEAQPLVSCPAGARLVTAAGPEGRSEHCEPVPGVRHGPIVSQDGTGQRRLEGQFLDGKPDGRWRGWHANGRASGVAEFRAGELHQMVAWFEDGTLSG
jgi:hypothetical protein